jgi:hypothetical protein
MISNRMLPWLTPPPTKFEAGFYLKSEARR